MWLASLVSRATDAPDVVTPLTLVVMRHAKAKKRRDTLPDMQRKLTKTWKKHARQQAKTLHAWLKKYAQKQKNPMILKRVCLLTSTASRAIQTASRVAKRLGISKKHIFQESTLYSGYATTIRHNVALLQQRGYATIIVVGHNPSISTYARQVSKKAIMELRTGDLVIVPTGSAPQVQPR